MNSQMLSCFRAVCQTHNFTKAAELLYISQSSLSKQLKNLEEELGCQLIERSKSTPPHLTEAGVIFQRYCDQVMQLHSDLLHELQPFLLCPESSLRISSIPMMLDYGAVRSITTFQTHNPDLKIEYSECSQQLALQALDNHSVDIAIVRIDNLDLSRYDVIVIGQEELVCVCNSSSPLAQKAELSLPELRSKCFVSYDNSSALYSHLLESCAKAGFAPNIVRTSSRINIVLGMLSENTDTISLLPAELAKNLKSRFPVTTVRLTDPLITRTAFVKLKNPGGKQSTASSFWKHVRSDFD